ncbi:MAG: flagellar biosynthesis regulator FlaF [Proteobacteria bacterium]|nr:flagellar biosynthesis regulator FlaF [Pseudomonadota bacterium]
MSQASSSQAYRSSGKLGASAAQSEARALLETARMMDACVGDTEDLDAYKAALRLNWRLWTIFQADVSSADSQLPLDIKENILSLSVFVDKHAVSALAEPAGRKLRVLIEINRNIASGLMATPKDAAAGASGDTDASTPEAAAQRPKTDDILA